MKYLNLFIFLILMIFTWNIVHTTEGVSEYTHAGIQDDLKTFIADYIREQIPSAREIEFEKFWTKEMKRNRIKVTFLYSFVENLQNEQPARTSIEGHAILQQQAASNGEYDFWSLEQLQILNNKVEFQDGMIIKSLDQ